MSSRLARRALMVIILGLASWGFRTAPVVEASQDAYCYTCWTEHFCPNARTMDQGCMAICGGGVGFFCTIGSCEGIDAGWDCVGYPQ